MSPLTVVVYVGNSLRLVRRASVVATESIVANLMMVLNMRGAYTRSLNVNSAR